MARRDIIDILSQVIQQIGYYTRWVPAMQYRPAPLFTGLVTLRRADTRTQVGHYVTLRAQRAIEGVNGIFGRQNAIVRWELPKSHSVAQRSALIL
jgi:hypothetical protein